MVAPPLSSACHRLAPLPPRTTQVHRFTDKQASSNTNFLSFAPCVIKIGCQQFVFCLLSEQSIPILLVFLVYLEEQHHINWFRIILPYVSPRVRYHTLSNCIKLINILSKVLVSKDTTFKQFGLNLTLDSYYLYHLTSGKMRIFYPSNLALGN